VYDPGRRISSNAPRSLQRRIHGDEDDTAPIDRDNDRNRISRCFPVGSIWSITDDDTQRTIVYRSSAEYSRIPSCTSFEERVGFVFVVHDFHVAVGADPRTDTPSPTDDGIVVTVPTTVDRAIRSTAVGTEFVTQ